VGAPHPLELSLLQDAEEFGLQLEREVADLIQEEGPPVGELKASDLAGEGPVNAPFSWPNNSLSMSPAGSAAQDLLQALALADDLVTVVRRGDFLLQIDVLRLQPIFQLLHLALLAIAHVPRVWSVAGGVKDLDVPRRIAIGPARRQDIDALADHLVGRY
jgi:hypothetical protein